MKFHPASKLQTVPTELNGAHQCQYIHFINSSAFKLVDGKTTGWGGLCHFDEDDNVIAVYVGGLHENEAQGEGQLHIKAENFSYIGGWRDNVASGWGKWCDSWTEEWPEGSMCYKVVTRVPKTMTYVGGFEDGYFHGYGELTWENGANYKGSWKEGRRDGCGIYINKEGTDAYYWTVSLPSNCNPSEDDESDEYKNEHKLRLAAEKKLKKEKEKEKEEETKRKEEHRRRLEKQHELEKKQKELDDEIQKFSNEQLARERAEMTLQIKEQQGYCHIF